MIFTETLFIKKKPIGVIRCDNFSGLIAFCPNEPPSKLPDREFSNIEDLKTAVIKAYSNREGHDDCSSAR